MVTIQWYPGHMEKARRDMAEHLKAVDMIIEVRDARIPLSSHNPVLEELAPQKPRLILLSKIDLADEEATAAFVRKLNRDDCICMAMNLAKDRDVRKKVVQACQQLTKAKRERMIRRGIRPRAMRAMAVGIPNCGKSTLINRIAGRSSAKTEDRPGVTRSLTWIHADPTLEILDTPGVLWPKFENQRVGSLLAATGAINDTILDLKEVAMDTIHVIRDLYPMRLEKEYETDPAIRTDAMLEAIAEKRNLLQADGAADRDRAASLFLHELRRGRLGKMTLEREEDESEAGVSE